jgi:hypothetical protein
MGSSSPTPGSSVMGMRCRECHDLKPLNAQGVCDWRAGCEHRQLQAEARARQVDDALDRILQPQPVESDRRFRWIPPPFDYDWGEWGPSD